MANIWGGRVQHGDKPHSRQEDEYPAPIEPEHFHQFYINVRRQVRTNNVQHIHPQQQHEHHQHRQHHYGRGDEHIERYKNPHGAAFTHPVDAVNGAAEGTNIARGRPEGAQNTDKKRNTRALAVGELPDRVFDDTVHLLRRVFLQKFQDDRGTFLALPDNTEKRDEGQQPREDRQHREVGECGRRIGSVAAQEVKTCTSKNMADASPGEIFQTHLRGFCRVLVKL